MQTNEEIREKIRQSNRNKTGPRGFFSEAASPCFRTCLSTAFFFFFFLDILALKIDRADAVPDPNASTDLQGCNKMGETYFCKGRNVLRTDLTKTCLGAAYLADNQNIHSRFAVEDYCFQFCTVRFKLSHHLCQTPPKNGRDIR